MKRLLVLFVLISFYLNAEEQVIHFNGSGSLPERWKWGLQQGVASKNEFWIACSFDRQMYQNEMIGSWYGDKIRRQTLQELLSGKRVTEIPKHISGRGQKVMKPVAVLMKYDRNGQNVQEIKVSNLDLHVDLEGLPLIWLGSAEIQESLNWLSTMYSNVHDEDSKENLIDAIGIHHSPEVISILQPLLSERSEGLRARAAFWLGNLDDPKALEIIKKVLPVETSEDVLDEAMAGMNDSELPEVTQILSDWAEKSSNFELRKKAIFWLGQKAVRNVQEKIKNMAFHDKDTEIEKQAVIALAEMEENAGVPQLIQIAKTHPNLEVRKTAITFLGDSEDPRAHQALLDILQEK